MYHRSAFVGFLRVCRAFLRYGLHRTYARFVACNWKLCRNLKCQIIDSQEWPFFFLLIMFLNVAGWSALYVMHILLGGCYWSDSRHTFASVWLYCGNKTRKLHELWTIIWAQIKKAVGAQKKAEIAARSEKKNCRTGDSAIRLILSDRLRAIKSRINESIDGKYVLKRNVCINQYLYIFTIITLVCFSVSLSPCTDVCAKNYSDGQRTAHSSSVIYQQHRSSSHLAFTLHLNQAIDLIIGYFLFSAPIWWRRCPPLRHSASYAFHLLRSFAWSPLSLLPVVCCISFSARIRRTHRIWLLLLLLCAAFFFCLQKSISCTPNYA